MSQLIVYCNNELNLGGGISLHVIRFLHLICKDIDECADESLNDCPPETTHCVNSFGNYSCECKPGFQGQGSHCKGNTLTILYRKFSVCILTLINIFRYFNIFPIYHSISLFVCQFIK